MSRLRLLLIILLVVVVLASAAFAVIEFRDNNETAARYVPAGAVGFITVDMRPSISQIRKLQALSENIPKDADAPSPWANQILQQLLDYREIDFNDDIKPWVKDEISIAWTSTEDGDIQETTFFKTSNKSKAVTALDQHGVNSDERRVIGESVVTSKDHLHGDANIRALDKVEQVFNGDAESLADSNEKYKTTLKQLQSNSFVDGWIDMPGISKLDGVLNDNSFVRLQTLGLLPFQVSSYDSIGPDFESRSQRVIDNMGSVGFTTRANKTSLQVEFITEHQLSESTPAKSQELFARIPSNVASAEELDSSIATREGLKALLTDHYFETRYGTDAWDQLDEYLQNFDPQINEILSNLQNQSLTVTTHDSDWDSPNVDIATANNETGVRAALPTFADKLRTSNVDVTEVYVGGGFGLLLGSSTDSDGRNYLGTSKDRFVIADSLSNLTRFLNPQPPYLLEDKRLENIFRQRSEPASARTFISLKGFDALNPEMLPLETKHNVDTSGPAMGVTQRNVDDHTEIRLIIDYSAKQNG